MQDSNGVKDCKNWYEKAYTEAGFKAQRLYPNEQLLKFMGREFFCKTEPHERKNIKVLEIGCGSCSNLWMIGREGFQAFGLDLSEQSLELGEKMLDHWGTTAELKAGSMTDLPYSDGFFDVVIDVFSSNCLPLADFKRCLDEVTRVLGKNGLFFSYTPSVDSDAFKNYEPAAKIDEWTIDGIKRPGSPFLGNNYPFRFISLANYRKEIEDRGFEVTRAEKVGHTYRDAKEYFEFIAISGKLN